MEQYDKEIKQAMSEAIQENIKDFYINISGKVAINSSKIVAVETEYKRYNTYWELEKDGLSEIAEVQETFESSYNKIKDYVIPLRIKHSSTNELSDLLNEGVVAVKYKPYTEWVNEQRSTTNV